MDHGRKPFPLRYLTASLSAGLCLAGSQYHPGHAYPVSAPLWGPTGLGTIPTSDTVPAHNGEVSIGYEEIKPSVGKTHFSPVLTATYGLPRAELGVGYLSEHTSLPGVSISSHYTTLHAKYRLFESKTNGAAVAVGIHHLDFGSLPGHVTSLYLVGSYPLLRATADQGSVRAHLGIIHHRVQSGTGSNDTRPLAGLDWALRHGFTLAADYAPHQGASVQLWSLVARYQARGGWEGQVGYGRLRGNDRKLLIGLGYQFGKHEP